MRYMIILLIAWNCAYFTWQVTWNESGTPVERVLTTLPPDVRPLVTLREQNAQQSREEARQIEDVTATRPPGAFIPLSCQAIGPFLAKSEMKAIEKRLNKNGFIAREQTRYVQERVGYAVVLPAMKYAEALQIKQKLEKEDITANFIGRDNVLSLGAFRDKSLAEKKLARADAIGLDPRLEPSYANRGSYWLVFQGRDNRDKSLAGLIRKNSDLRVENFACP